MTFFKNRFVTMIETPKFLSSDIIAEKSGYRTNNFLEPILCYFYDYQTIGDFNILFLILFIIPFECMVK